MSQPEYRYSEQVDYDLTWIEEPTEPGSEHYVSPDILGEFIKLLDRLENFPESANLYVWNGCMELDWEWGHLMLGRTKASMYIISGRPQTRHGHEDNDYYNLTTSDEDITALVDAINEKFRWEKDQNG